LQEPGCFHKHCCDGHQHCKAPRVPRTTDEEMEPGHHTRRIP
jgi:hypothetical protein